MRTKSNKMIKFNDIQFLFIILLVASVIVLSACTNSTQQPATTGTGNNAGTPVTTTGGDTANTGGTPAPNTGDVKVINVEAYSFGFNVTGPQINKGDKVKIIVTSTSGTHGFAMPDFNIDISPISPGETKSAEFIADKSGTFTYFCNVPCGPGHRSMTGTITIA